MHQSFVSTAQPWDSRGKVLDNYFLIVPAVPGKCGGIKLGHLPCWDFLLCRVGQRAGLFCLFLLLYVPCQQLWSLRDGQFT